MARKCGKDVGVQYRLGQIYIPMDNCSLLVDVIDDGSMRVTSKTPITIITKYDTNYTTTATILLTTTSIITCIP